MAGPTELRSVNSNYKRSAKQCNGLPARQSPGGYRRFYIEGEVNGSGPLRVVAYDPLATDRPAKRGSAGFRLGHGNRRKISLSWQPEFQSQFNLVYDKAKGTIIISLSVIGISQDALPYGGAEAADRHAQLASPANQRVLEPVQRTTSRLWHAVRTWATAAGGPPETTPTPPPSNVIFDGE